MTESQHQPSVSRRHKRRQSQTRQKATRFLAEWHVEIIIVILILLAVFLLVEQMQIRQTLLSGLRQGLQGLSNLGQVTLQALDRLVRNTTLSDLTGYTLLFIAFAFIAWRIRWRLMTLPRLRTTVCPRCGSDLHRIKRRRVDRWLSLYVPVRRYQCRDHDCQWQGLRVSTSRHG
jgi:uncharacterized integral membrane protein